MRQAVRAHLARLDPSLCAIEGVRPWQDALVAAGAKRRNTVIWYKVTCAPKMQGDGPAAACEALVTAWAGTGNSKWNGGGGQGYYAYQRDATEKLRHNCQKPAALMERIIADFTMPGDLVLDPFLGGGATAIAAKRLGRLYAGYEIDKDSLARAEKALAATTQQHSLFGQPKAKKDYRNKAQKLLF